MCGGRWSLCDIMCGGRWSLCDIKCVVVGGLFVTLNVWW